MTVAATIRCPAEHTDGGVCKTSTTARERRIRGGGYSY